MINKPMNSYKCSTLLAPRSMEMKSMRSQNRSMQSTQEEWQQYLLLVLLAAIVVLLPLLLKLRPPRSKHGKNLPPGPWRLPVIGSLHHLAGKLPHRAMRDLARRHGPLMLLRMGELDVVVASSAEAAREVMKTKDVAFATRPRTPTMRALTSDGLGIALAPYGEHWRQMRKLCVTELFSARRVRSFRSIREAETAGLVASVAAASSSSPAASKPVVVNISSLIAMHVTDSSMRAIVGDRISNREAFLASLDDVIKVAAEFSLADMFPSSRLAYVFSGVARRAEKVIREITRLMDDVIDEHRTRRSSAGGDGHGAGDGKEEEEDLLDVLLRIQSDGGLPVPLDIGAIRMVMRDILGGGSETSTTTLQWAMTELMRNPAALRRAQAEVRGALAGRKSRVTEDDLPDLRYMHLVIKETLRLHAILPLLLPRECRERPSCRVLGYDVPEGAVVLVNVWAIGRDAATWGADAEEFRPERFDEEGAAAVDFRGADFQFVPFGAGRRMCPGMAFGLATVELTLASLLFHFDWELPHGVDELDMTESFGLTASRKTDLCLHATVRVPPPPAAPTI